MKEKNPWDITDVVLLAVIKTPRTHSRAVIPNVDAVCAVVSARTVDPFFTLIRMVGDARLFVPITPAAYTLIDFPVTKNDAGKVTVPTADVVSMSVVSDVDVFTVLLVTCVYKFPTL